MISKKIAIIGGGASGLFAAISAKRENTNCEIFVFERLNRVGKKILATGNGQCNISNINAGNTFLKKGKQLPVFYHGENPDFALFALKTLNVEKTIDFFESLGMLTQKINDKLYPLTLNASTVVDILRLYCEKLKVNFVVDCTISEIKKNKNIFLINGEQFDSVIVCCGGKSSPHLGSDGSGYKLLTNFGHKCTTLSPAITQIKTETNFVKQLKGIKVNANVSIYVNNNKIRSDYGQILFAEYGLSGPPIFQLSLIASKNYDKNTVIQLDFMPEWDVNYISEKIKNIILNPFTLNLTNELLLSPFINKRLGQVIIKYCGLPLNQESKSLSQMDISKIATAIKHFKLKVTGVQGFNNAQVTAGGILTKDFDDKTMESLIVKNIYACGEILDITGDCGGFNLQWAFSSGYLAGKSAAREFNLK